MPASCIGVAIEVDPIRPLFPRLFTDRVSSSAKPRQHRHDAIEFSSSQKRYAQPTHSMAARYTSRLSASPPMATPTPVPIK